MNGKQLKNSILQWAIQGKLVPQDPNDEPASVLLERIREEKARLVKEGKIKKDKNESIIFRGDDNSHYEKFLATGEVKCIDDEIPFEIPQSWCWVRLGSIIDFSKSSSVKPNEIAPEAWVLDLEDIEKDTGVLLAKKRMKDIQSKSDKHIFYSGNVLYSKLRPYLNKVIIADENGYCTSEILAFDFGMILNKYAQIYLMSPYFVDYAMSDAYGVKMPRLGSKQGNNALMPLPPFKEQARIAEQLANITPIVNRYASSQSELDRLNAELFEKLKKSVLQEAIQGKLVPQSLNDEPASVLLERIKAEKAKLFKEGKLKKKDLVDSVIFKGEDNKYFEKVENDVLYLEEEIPFEIPETWTWVRLNDICEYIQRGKSPKYSEVKKYPVVAQKCNQWSGFSLEKALFIDPNTLPSYGQERFLQHGDLLWNSTGLGTLGRMAIYNESVNPYGVAVADSHVTVIRPIKSFINFEYLYLYFSSNEVQSVIEDKADGSTKQKELATRTIKSYLVPLQPLSEQYRIVAKYHSVASIMSR